MLPRAPAQLIGILVGPQRRVVQVSDLVPLQGGLEIYGSDRQGNHVYIPANSSLPDHEYVIASGQRQEEQRIKQSSLKRYVVSATSLSSPSEEERRREQETTRERERKHAQEEAKRRERAEEKAKQREQEMMRELEALRERERQRAEDEATRREEEDRRRADPMRERQRAEEEARREEERRRELRRPGIAYRSGLAGQNGRGRREGGNGGGDKGWLFGDVGEGIHELGRKISPWLSGPLFPEEKANTAN